MANRILLLGAGDGSFPYDPAKSRWAPLPSSEFKVDNRSQPYFKLHGSWRWFDGAGQQMMVMGASNPATIAAHPVLAWYHEEFRQLLSGDTRLMVVGYGFQDPHINETILNIAGSSGLRMFLIDPLGVDAAKPGPARLNPFKEVIRGSSKRSLAEIFGSDAFAHDSVRRFLEE
jgi:hypothetical protein